MKKLALFLALIMVVAACVIPVSAADETKTISFEAHNGDSAYLVADLSTTTWRPDLGGSNDEYYALKKGEQLVYKFTLEGNASSAKITMPALGVYEIWAGSTIEGAKKVYTSAQLNSFNDAYCGGTDNWGTKGLAMNEYTTVFEPLLDEIDLTSALDGTTLYVILKCTDNIPSDIYTGIWNKAAVAASLKYVNRRWNLANNFSKDGGEAGSRAAKTEVAAGETYSDGMVTLTYTLAPAAPDPAKGIPMLNFDQAYFGALDTENQVEGTGCCSFTFKNASGTEVFQKRFDAPVDVSECEYIFFWFYISDASKIGKITGGQLEICSGGTCDAEEATFSGTIKNYIENPKDGWNLVRLPLAGMKGCDFSRVNYFRLYMADSADLVDVTVKFDNMFGITPPAPVKMLDFDKQYFGILDELGHIDGTGCNSYTLHKTTNAQVFQKAFDAPVDLTGCDYVAFWFYISDASAIDLIGGGQIEITSGGKNDVEETNWLPNGGNLKNYIVGEPQNGWNLVRLPIAEANAKGADWSRINFFRMYFVPDKDGLENVTIKFDNMYAYAEDAVIPANNRLINIPAAPEAAEGIEITLAPDAFKKLTVKSDFAPDTKFDPVDISKCENIEFDMFIADADYFEMAIGQGQLEFGSKEVCDHAERAIMYKDIANYIEGGAKAGWNHVIIPIDKLSEADGNDKMDLTALMRIRYFNVQISSGVNTVVALANFVASPIPAPETEPVTEPETEPETEPATEPATEPETEAPTDPVVDPQPSTFDATASIAIVTVAAMGIVLVSSKKRH